MSASLRETGSRADASSPSVSTKGFDPARMIALAERCEKATGPDRELDRDIAAAVHMKQLTYQRGEWIKDPEFTASLDAAMTLVPEGGKPVRLYIDDIATAAFIGKVEVAASTPALALCAAALRARAQ